MKKFIALFAASAFVFGAGMSVAVSPCGLYPSQCKPLCKGDPDYSACMDDCLNNCRTQ